MRTKDETNLIYAFVHKNFKRVTKKGKEIYYHAKVWLPIASLPKREYNHLLTLAKMEEGNHGNV